MCHLLDQPSNHISSFNGLNQARLTFLLRGLRLAPAVKQPSPSLAPKLLDSLTIITNQTSSKHMHSTSFLVKLLVKFVSLVHWSSPSPGTQMDAT